MGVIHIEVDSSFNNTKGFLRAFSFFDGEERKIAIKDASSRKIADEISESKNFANARINEAINEGFIIVKGDYYIVPEAKPSYIELEEKFYKRMLSTFSSNTNNIYVWLYRRFKYAKSNHKPCYFTLGDLCRALGLSDQDKNRKKMTDSLIQLALNGLIEFRVVRYGRTYLRQLVDIRTEFVVIDTCQEIIESKTSGTKEFEGNTETIELDPELAETVMSIGLSQDKVNELKNGQEISQLMEADTIIVEMSNKEVKKKSKSSGRMWNIW